MKTSSWQFPFPSESLKARQIKFPIGSALKRVLQAFIQLFSDNNEPRIWLTTDRYGNTFWHAYDPVSDKSVTCCSEDEMRAWIERRYYS